MAILTSLCLWREQHCHGSLFIWATKQILLRKEMHSPHLRTGLRNQEQTVLFWYTHRICATCPVPNPERAKPFSATYLPCEFWYHPELMSLVAWVWSTVISTDQPSPELIIYSRCPTKLVLYILIREPMLAVISHYYVFLLPKLEWGGWIIHQLFIILFAFDFSSSFYPNVYFLSH